MAGGLSGPTDSGSTCPDGEWNFPYCKGQACSYYTSCIGCTKSPFCGWLTSCNECVEATKSRRMSERDAEDANALAPFTYDGNFCQSEPGLVGTTTAPKL